MLFKAVFQGAFAAVLAGLLYTTAVTLLGPGPTTMIGAVVPALAALAAWVMGGAGGRVDPPRPRT